MELHVDIRITGSEFPTSTEKEQIDALVEQLDVSSFGPVIDTGSGRGHADIFLRIKASAEKEAIGVARAILDSSPFAGRSSIRVLRGKRELGDIVRLPNPGDAFAFPVFKTRFGSCRVLRTPTANEEAFFSGAAVLVATSSWIGDVIPDPSAPPLRETLVLTHHSHKGCRAVVWVNAAVPDSYQHIGCITPSADETVLECNVHGAWACALHVEAQHLWNKEKNG